MRVAVYHNVARDDEDRHVNFFGYQPGHPLVLVFVYDTGLPGGDLPELLRISEAAFEAFNIDTEMLQGKQRELAARYRDRKLRSLSVGDVLRIGDNIALACEPVGFSEVSGDLNEVCIEEPGTHPDPDA